MTRKRLGEMLLETGVIDEHKLQAALGHQRKWGGRLGQALVDLKLATEAQIVEALSRKFGYEVVQGGALEPGPGIESALKLLPREFAAQHNLIPYRADSTAIAVAMADPANVAVVDEIRFRTGRRVQIALAGDREISEAIRRHYFGEAAPSESAPLEFEQTDAPVDPIIEQFGGGSEEDFESFYSPPVSPQPAPAPQPAARPQPPAPAPRPAARPAPAGRASELELEDHAPGGEPLPEEKTTTLELPIEEGPAEDEAGNLWAEGPVEGPPGLRAPAAADRELQLLEVVDRVADGEAVAPEVVKPARMTAALVRLLIRKGVISETEFLAEFEKK